METLITILAFAVVLMIVGIALDAARRMQRPCQGSLAALSGAELGFPGTN
jgi:hypothetical protein